MRKNITFMITTILLLAVTVLFSVRTVTAQKEGYITKDSAVIKQMEKEYLENIKETLVSKHIVNSGVTMTKIIYEDGRREYTVTIHNDMINRLSVEKREELEETLAKTDFPVQNCQVYHEFLMID